MNRRGLGARDRRALWAGALILFPLLLITYVIQPYRRALAEAKDQLHAERELLSREASLLEASSTYPNLISQSEANLAAIELRLFHGPDMISMSGDLVGYLGSMAQGHRVLLQRSETGVAEGTEEGIWILPVTASAVGDLEGILGFLHAIEAGEKLIHVEKLTIQTQGVRPSQASRDEEVLSVSAVIQGYGLLPEEMTAGRASDEGDSGR